MTKDPQILIDALEAIKNELDGEPSEENCTRAYQRSKAALTSYAGAAEAEKTGIQLIQIERQEQIKKHNRTVAYDVEKNDDGELARGAKAVIDGEDGQFPAGWDLVLIQKMCDKPYRDRLIIAGAFIAAELDRLAATKQEGGSL